MRLRYRVPLRHPFHSDWVATPARAAGERCAVISGGTSELARAAAAGVRAERAVFALQYPDGPFLSEAEREELWQQFQVPVFSVLLDRTGRVTAWECEAQDGLHVGRGWTEDALWVCRLLARGFALDSSPCECGRPGRRLRAASAMPAVPRRGPGREERREPVVILGRA
jgi:hypothetical protein